MQKRYKTYVDWELQQTRKFLRFYWKFNILPGHLIPKTRIMFTEQIFFRIAVIAVYYFMNIIIVL